MKEQIIKAIKSMEEETLLEVLYRSALCPEELGMSEIDQCGGRGCKTCWKQSKIIKTLDEEETAQEVPVQEKSANKNHIESKIINLLIEGKVLADEANAILDQVRKLIPTYYQLK